MATANAITADDLLAYVLRAFETLPGLISGGANISTFVQETMAKIKEMQAAGRAPTQQEWDDLNKRIADLRNRLHSP